MTSKNRFEKIVSVLAKVGTVMPLNFGTKWKQDKLQINITVKFFLENSTKLGQNEIT